MQNGTLRALLEYFAGDSKMTCCPQPPVPALGVRIGRLYHRTINRARPQTCYYVIDGFQDPFHACVSRIPKKLLIP